MDMRDPSPQTTLLILLGASTWPLSPEFQSSEAFANAARGMKAYFLNPHLFGLPKENLLDLFDSEKGADDMDAAIGEFVEQRLVAMKATGNAGRDLLLYFIGHGGFAGGNYEYYLAIRRTRSGNPLASGLQVASLAYTLKEQARHLRRILILDCCFAQSAFSFLQAGPDQVALRQTIDAFQAGSKTKGVPTKGTTLLSSSNQKTPSLLLSDSSSTMFTKAFLDALTQGTSSQRDRLTLRDVKEATWDLLSEMRDAPRPVVDSPDQSEGDVADIPFFPNPWFEKERLRRAEEERARVAEEERVRLAEEERVRKAEEDRRRQAEAERTRLAEEEKERARLAEVERLKKAEEEQEQLRRVEEEKRRQAEEERMLKAREEEQASQVKQPEPEPVPVAPISETTDTNQSQQPTEMVTPVPVIPSSQQTVSDVSADIPAQSHTILPLSGRERLPQAEEERRRQAEKERIRQAEEDKRRQAEAEQARLAEVKRVKRAKKQARLAEKERARKAEEEQARLAGAEQVGFDITPLEHLIAQNNPSWQGTHVIEKDDNSTSTVDTQVFSPRLFTNSDDPINNSLQHRKINPLKLYINKNYTIFVEYIRIHFLKNDFDRAVYSILGTLALSWLFSSIFTWIDPSYDATNASSYPKFLYNQNLDVFKLNQYIFNIIRAELLILYNSMIWSNIFYKRIAKITALGFSFSGLLLVIIYYIFIKTHINGFLMNLLYYIVGANYILGLIVGAAFSALIFFFLSKISDKINKVK